MTDRVLTVEEVDEMEGWVRTFRKLFPDDAIKLITSHRVLQQRVKKLETLIPKRLIQQVGGTETHGD